MTAHLQKVTERLKLLQRIVEIKKEHSAYETKSFKTNNALKTIVGSFDSEIWWEQFDWNHPSNWIFEPNQWVKSSIGAFKSIRWTFAHTQMTLFSKTTNPNQRETQTHRKTHTLQANWLELQIWIGSGLICIPY